MQPEPSTLLFGWDAAEWRRRGAHVTAREIAGQPALWRALADLLEERSDAVDAFLAEPMSRPNLAIVFAGAGTSAFAGGVVAAEATTATGRAARALATTDIVEGWNRFLDPDQPLLLVSFARSGDSPESLAAVEITERHGREVWQLFITCNPDGALARAAADSPRRFALVMPEGSCDQGFAMTGSFSVMTLAALAIFTGQAPASRAALLRLLSREAEATLERWPEAAELANERHERVVYLGSGPIRDAAAECALKLLELTDGEVVALSYSPLAFRHGPKTVVNGPQTLVVSLLAAEPTAERYGADMARELAGDGRASQLVLGGRAGLDMGGAPQLASGPEAASAGDGWLAVLHVVFGQLYALFASQARGLPTDRPSRSGEVNRVVQNVSIYA